MSRCLTALFLAFALVDSVAVLAGQPDTMLTFVSNRSGRPLLYQARADGTESQPVFGGPIKEVPAFDESYKLFRQPCWARQSPNGKYFATAAYEMGEPYDAYQGPVRSMIHVGDLQQKWTRLFSPDSNLEFAWSPDSKQLAYSVLSDTNYRGSLQKNPISSEIFIAGIDGSKEICVLELLGNWFVLDWSPDGKRLLLEHRVFGEEAEGEGSDLFEFRLAEALAARQQQFRIVWPAKDAPRFLDQIKLAEKFSGDVRYSPTKRELAILTYDPKKM